MTDLTDLCERLDDSTDAILTTFEDILRCQALMDENMAQGYLCLSKARYSMGVNRVSALQYNEDSLQTAATKVKVTEDDGGLEFLSVKGGEKESVKDETKNDGLRQRKTVSDRIEDLNISEPNEDDRKPSDPLRWFGVLVPQALRKSQGHFQKATELSCRIATQKASLVRLRKQHSLLMEQKMKISPPKADASTDEDVSDDADSS